MKAIPLIPCCGQSGCLKCLGREWIPDPEALTQFSQERVVRGYISPSKPFTPQNLPAKELLERAYAMTECSTIAEAAETLGISPSALIRSLSVGMRRYGFKLLSSTAFEIRRYIKRFIVTLELEVIG